MAKTNVKHEISVQHRKEQGSRATSRLRHKGWVPGVVYGRNMESISISVNRRQLVKLLHETGERALVTLNLEDGESWKKPALMKAVQHDPVSGTIVHIDFHAILLTEEIKVKVAIQLKGEPVGVKQDGGILEHFLREVEVECLPTEIPEHIELDISALKIGETVHVRDLAPPKTAKILTDPESAVASVQAPKEEKPEEVAAVTEPEVIREKKEEEGAAPSEQGKAEQRAEPKKETKS